MNTCHDWLIKKVARWTNVKADLLKHSRPSWVANTRRWPPSYLRSWKRVTLEELRRWIAVLLARSMASGVSSREFWKENSFFDYSQGSHIMGRDRWLSISKCLCIYDPLKDPSFPHRLDMYFRKMESFLRILLLPRLHLMLHRQRINHTSRQQTFVICSPVSVDPTITQVVSCPVTNNV